MKPLFFYYTFIYHFYLLELTKQQNRPMSHDVLPDMLQGQVHGSNTVRHLGNL